MKSGPSVCQDNTPAWRLLKAFLLLAATALLFLPGCTKPRELDYQPADPELKVVLIDHIPEGSLVAVRVDSTGRIFAGGRERLFVYEPNAQGGYQPRRELYRFPAESWIFDVAIRGHDLYVLTASALYLIAEGVVRREGLQPRRILWGQPRGHIQLGFHGLAWGPEGDLYITMGDALQHYGDFTRPDHWGHWTLFSGPDNAPTAYTGVGAVLRCRPDGSRLQVFSTGSFNHFGLAFDHRWNLFSNDNDREAMPLRYAPARLLHVTPKSYFGWPRGWMAEKTPERADLLETMYEGLGRDATVGQAYYHETLLPARYRKNLLVARWAQRLISRHPLRPRGASFVCDEEPFLVGRNLARPLGLEVGRGGRIFATIGQMAHLEGSPIYDADLVMITTAADPPQHPFDAYDAPAAPAEKLWAELSDPSWHRRYQAHVEILRRGGALLEEAVGRLAAVASRDPAIHQLLWLAAASGRAEAGRLLRELAADSEVDVRVQALRALAEFPRLGAPGEVLARNLNDPEPRVQHAALLAFFDLPDPIPDAVLEGPARSKDTYLRQTAALLLSERASLSLFRKLSQAKDPAARLASVLAAGFRLTLPPPTEPIAPHLPLAPYPESANVIQFADTELDLRTQGRVGNFTVAEHWNVGKHSSEQEQLFNFLLRMLEDEDDQVRRQAAHFLFLLNSPRSEPIVARVIEKSDQQRLEGAPGKFLKRVTNAWVVGPFADGPEGLQAVHSPEQGPVDLSAMYHAGGKELSWRPMAARGYFDFGGALEAQDNASYYSYFVLESGTRQSIMFFVGSNDGVKVWYNSTPVWQNDAERRALMYNDMVMLRLQPGSNHLLVRVHNRTGDSGLYVHYKALEPVESFLPEKVDLSLLKERVSQADGSTRSRIPEAFLRVDWERAVIQGDSGRGKTLFEELACNRCHSLTPKGTGTVGPSLEKAHKRFGVLQLVEAILLPSRQISPLFRQTLVITREGEKLDGLVIGETAETIELVRSDTSRQTILKKNISERRLLELSPMPDDLVATPEELRDLLAYLLAG